MWSADLQTIRKVYALNWLLLIGLPIYGAQVSIPALLCAFFIFGCLGVIVTYHRFHSHGSFSFRWKWLEVLFTMLAMFSGTGSTIGWVAIHRQHHKYADTVNDPHDHTGIGAWNTLSINYPYRKRWKNVRDLVRKPYLLHFHKYYFLYLLGYVSLCSLGGLWTLYNLFIAPSVLVFIASGLTNLYNHGTMGYKPYPEASGRNIWWLNLFNFGDGWHNNHHENPRAFSTKEKWWEFDPAGLIIGVVGCHRK